MATVFETRLIGNIGKDAIVKTMERNVLAINFPVKIGKTNEAVKRKQKPPG